MSRYIDIKWLDENAKEYSLGYYDYDEYAVPLSAVEDAPTIEIIRCGECKYCVNGQCWKSDGLDKLDGNVADDDFCSRGEREGE